MSIYQARPVYIAASYLAPVGRYDGRHREKLSFLELAEKCSAIFKESGIRPEKVDTVVVGCQNPVAFSGVDNTAAKVAGVLGISGAKSILIDTASSSGASAVENGYMEIASGRAETVLAIGIQKMSDAATVAATNIVAGVIDGDESEYGLTMPACGALVARALMDRLDLDLEEWTAFSALLTERAQKYAARTPHAHLSFELPVKEYYRQIADGKNYLYWWPLRYHDFCPMSDGVAAILLTSKPQDTLIAGVGSATDIPTIADRRYYHSFPATVRAAANAYGMAGITNIRKLAGRLHVNMHDPFNGFGPINMIDLGILPRRHLLDGLLDDGLTGEHGEFPTNLTGGLKGRGHPLGATGMIQVVENHQFIQEKGFTAGLSHSIGGPINNNVVILIERTDQHQRRKPVPFKPWGLPDLGRLKPKEATLENCLADGIVHARFITSTTCFNHKTGAALNSIVIVSSVRNDQRYSFLFGIPGEHFHSIAGLTPGDMVSLEQTATGVLLNRLPVQRIYQRTFQGLKEMAESGWRKIRGK